MYHPGTPALLCVVTQGGSEVGKSREVSALASHREALDSGESSRTEGLEQAGRVGNRMSPVDLNWPPSSHSKE